MTQRLTVGLFLFVSLLPMALWKVHPLNLALTLTLSVWFYSLVVKMNRQLSFKKKLEIYLEFCQRQWRKSNGSFAEYSVHLSLLSSKQEILCNDLNLLGQKSLFGYLDECVTSQGRRRLFDLLTRSPWNLKQILHRQKVLQQLAQRPWPLVKFKIISQLKAATIELEDLRQEIQKPVVTDKFYRMYAIHLVTFVVVWVMVILSLAGLVHVSPLLPFVVYLLFSLSSRGSLEGSFSKAQSYAYQLELLQPLFDFIEKNFEKAPYAEHFKATLRSRPSLKLRKLNRLISFLSTEGHPMVHIVLNALCPWDYFFSFLVESWRLGFAKDYSDIIDELNEFEAVLSCSFLTIYQSQNFPEIGESPILSFKAAFHPLIPRENVVANDFDFSADKKLILVTGSNMSGKSTFLRTVGVNQLLALMGCPVFAVSMQTFVAPVMTCLKVSDSVTEGWSSFYYEVKQVAHILDEVRGGQKVVYLIDEIFRGTNNRERLEGSQKVIAELIRSAKALGFVSTHDLELTTMEDTYPQLSNWHFKDDVAESRLVFDYRIHPGPCPTTNALKILKEEGIF